MTAELTRSHSVTSSNTLTPEIAAQRAYLEARNGISGLEILGTGDIDRAVLLFRRDGFVVIADVLNAEQTAFLAAGCAEVAAEVLALDQARNGNRGSHRYSFGGSSLTRSQLHRPEWQMLLDIPAGTSVCQEQKAISRSIPMSATGSAPRCRGSVLSTTRAAS
jgi:hypothetical protein